jgi:hypothetical protein
MCGNFCAHIILVEHQHHQSQQKIKRTTISPAKCIGRESNPGLAESIGSEEV